MDIAGKTIAVVGNAQSLLAMRHGAAIDGHDVVLRMNRGLPEVPPAQGRRTDILAFATFQLVRDLHERFRARRYVWMSPKGREDAAAAGLPAATEFYDLGRWQAVHDRLGARPSVGAMVLDYLSALGPAAVTVFGFDFKRTRTFYRPDDFVGCHDYRAEEAFCTALARERGWRLVRDQAAA